MYLEVRKFCTLPEWMKTLRYRIDGEVYGSYVKECVAEEKGQHRSYGRKKLTNSSEASGIGK